MVTVKKATIDLFEKIYPLIDYFNIQKLNKDDWYSLLSLRWSSEYDHFGYILVDQDKVVGFLGAFFHERTIEGKTHQICNLFCWYVLKEYRRESLSLILAALKEKNVTVTSLTPSQDASKIQKMLQFITLETSVKIFTPLSAFFPASKGILSNDSDLIRSLLNEQELVYFNDHLLPKMCSHLVFSSNGVNDSYCYIIYNTVSKKHISFTQIYYLSNPELFKTCLPRIQRYLFKANRSLFIITDKRLLKGYSPRLGFEHKLRYQRLYRSPNLTPEHLDNLYTELLFLREV